MFAISLLGVRPEKLMIYPTVAVKMYWYTWYIK